MACFFLNFFFLKGNNANGKIGTDKFTQTAVNAFVRTSGIRRMIPFTIELGRFL